MIILACFMLKRRASIIYSFKCVVAKQAWEVISEVVGFKGSKTKQKATKTNLHSLVCPLPYNCCLHDGKG
jgi:hypothetical protein